MNFAQVFHLGRRVDRIHVPQLRSLSRWPYHGMLGAIAWRFDGARLTLVRVNPRMRDISRPLSLKARG